MRTGEALSLAVVLCAIAYVSWRVWKWSTRFRWSRTLLLPPNQLSWSAPQSPGEKTGSGRSKRNSSAHARSKAPTAPDEPAAAPGAAATLAAVDTDVLHAIQVSTAEQLRAVNSIHDYVEANFHDISAASAQAWMQRLEDYVAEQQAAVALEKRGHAVRLHADQAGWRWLVDGQPIEIRKSVSSTAGAKHAVTDLRAAAEAKGGLVHGLSDFDHDAISTASKDALGVIHEGLDPGLHIPFGTLLRSAWREMELLLDKKTPIERAVKHVAMDVASVGTGAFLGAKVGGGLGAVAGPLGVGAGVLVGAMAGAIAGRGLAHKSRMAPFSKAYERYEATLGDARSAVDSALTESKAEVKQLESLFQEKFEGARSEIESAARQKLDEIERKQVESLKQFLRQFPNHLGALEAQLLHDEVAALGELPPTRWWNRIFPRRVDLEKSIIRKWFKRTRKIVKKERHRFEKLKDGPAAALHSKVLQFLSTYTFSVGSFDQSLNTLAGEFAEARMDAETVGQSALDEVEKVRDQMLVDFRSRISKMYFVLCQTISSWKEKVQVSLDELRRQAGPLGIELPD